MYDIVYELWVAVVLFAGTNVDDIFVLLAFFSDKRFKTNTIIFGQYLGIISLAGASVAIAVGAQNIPRSYIGFLGLIPILLGVKKLWEVCRSHTNVNDDDRHSPISLHHSAKILIVTGVTVANGGDNLGIYIPIFATKPLWALGLYFISFLVLTGIWCWLALYLIRHQHTGKIIKSVSPYIVPWIFLCLGTLILFESGSLNIITRLFQR